jgi:pyrimidine operon attenuation protein/uracil phosphoribosyltransferase
VPLAKIISINIFEIESVEIPVAFWILHFIVTICLTLIDARLNATEIPFPVIDKKIILVMMFYIPAELYARQSTQFLIRTPGAIQLAILIDRGHRELPIRADYVAKIFRHLK